MATLTFNNQSQGTSYVVISIIADPITGKISNTPKYISGSTFTSLTNIDRDMIVNDDYKVGIIVPEGNSSLVYTPGLTIPSNESIIRGAGNCSVTITGAPSTINVSSEELNSTGVTLPQIQ
tara:strand:- start:5082 stop:5444 length:363 start_codon:yes stop_codon:yes gene_type:complete